MSEKLAQLEKKGGGGEDLKVIGDLMATYQLVPIGQGAILMGVTSSTTRRASKNTNELAIAFNYSTDGNYKGWGLVGLTSTSVELTSLTSYAESDYSSFNYKGKTIYVGFLRYQLVSTQNPTISANGISLPYLDDFDDIKDYLGLAITSLG